MDNLAIASPCKDKISQWIDALAAPYSVVFMDSIEHILSEKKIYDDLLLVVDFSLINEINQLSLLCQYIKKVIVVGENLSSEQKIQIIYDGAWGYSDYTVDKQLMVKAVEGVLNDEIWLERHLIPKMLKGAIAKHKVSIDSDIFETISVLTHREIEVIELVYNGEDNTSISEALNITNRTVKAHLSAIFRKFNVHDRFQLVVFLKNLQVGQSASVNDLF